MKNLRSILQITALLLGFSLVGCSNGDGGGAGSGDTYARTPYQDSDYFYGDALDASFHCNDNFGGGGYGGQNIAYNYHGTDQFRCLPYAQNGFYAAYGFNYGPHLMHGSNVIRGCAIGTSECGCVAASAGTLGVSMGVCTY